MNIKLEELEKEEEQWKGYYHNYNNLAIQVLADVLAFYKEEDRKELIDKTNEFLQQNVKEPINGDLMVDTIKGDVESFDRISEEAAVAIRTLEWVKTLENKDIKTETTESTETTETTESTETTETTESTETTETTETAELIID